MHFYVEIFYLRTFRFPTSDDANKEEENNTKIPEVNQEYPAVPSANQYDESTQSENYTEDEKPILGISSKAVSSLAGGG